MSFISPTFTMEVLQTIQGYSLQAFASGRFKLSLHTTASHRSEYYAVAPKRDREAYQRQKLRSEHQCPEHFAAVETLLSERAAPRIFRLHEKTNSNDTADNAHILLDVERRDACLVLGEVLHFWPLPEDVLADILQATGSRRGEASVFNEYLRTYEHEWTNYHLSLDDYSRGYREVAPPQTRTPNAQPPHAEWHGDDLF